MRSLPATCACTLLILALFLALAGCEGGINTKREPALGERIGTLGVSGSNVFLNGNRARGGEAVRVGDSVTTGANSSGIIDFADGGSFQLDQNTDPIFVVKRLQAGFCILARILRGQVFIDKQQFCIETPALDAINNSRINIRVSSGQTTLSVIEGNVSVSRPQVIRVHAAQQIAATTQGNSRVRELNERELEDIVRWRKDYTFSGWCCTNGRRYPSDRAQCGTGAFSFDPSLSDRQCGQDFVLPLRGRPRPSARPDNPSGNQQTQPPDKPSAPPAPTDTQPSNPDPGWHRKPLDSIDLRRSPPQIQQPSPPVIR